MRLPKIFLPVGAAMQRPLFVKFSVFSFHIAVYIIHYSHNLSSSGVKKEVSHEPFFRRLSLLLCVLLLLITALSGCGTSPAAPSGPSTPQTPTAEEEALRRAPFQPVITCELAGEAETLTEEQQQAILSYTTMLCTALARPDDPLPEEPYTTDTLRQEALTRGFLWSSYIWGEQRVQVYPMNPIYRSEDAVEVWASLRVEANYSSDLTKTTGDTFGYGSLHHLTLNRTAQGWQVVGDDCEESDLCGYLSGCGTASLPSEDILAAIQNYLDLRAAVMAGRTPAAPDRCTAPLREDAQALAETAVDEYAVIYDVQCRPAYFAPMQQSGETVQVTLREILRVDHLWQGVIAATRTSVDHTLTLRRQTDGSWQVCGDSYEALGHTCAVTP